MKCVSVKFVVLLLVVLFGFSVLSFNVANAAGTGNFGFRAWIDGSDYLYVQAGGRVVWFEHLRYILPGLGNGNYSTYVDGAEWYPSWSGSISDKYNTSGSFPEGEWNITSLDVVSARNLISVVEYPSVENNFTAKIYLNDDPAGGADWYEFNLSWETAGELSVGDVASMAWVPSAPAAVGAAVVAAGAVIGLSALAIAASSASTVSAGGFFESFINKLRGVLPDAFKKWLENLIASRRKLQVDEKSGSAFLLTKSEVLVYVVSILLLTLSFAYVKVSTFEQFLSVLPTFFATSILVGLVKTYFGTLYSRRKGVWTEYKLWYFGVGLFLFSTLAFRVPFSSPTRSVHHSRNFTARLGGVLSLLSLFITLGFAVFFFILLKSGVTLIGSAGLGMCLIGAFFDTFPIKPMSGKDIYKYNKLLWAALFLLTLVLYAIWITAGV
jgi:hypothetical protein